jgi:hypothetical protein
MTIYAVSALLFLLVAALSRPARLRAAEKERERREKLLADKLCPTCSGEPFEYVQMNGLTGCFDCNSTGSAHVYLSGRR